MIKVEHDFRNRSVRKRITGRWDDLVFVVLRSVLCKVQGSRILSYKGSLKNYLLPY